MTPPPSHPEAPCVASGWGGWSPHKRDRAQAAMDCGPCPILAACHQAAEDRGERHGVWGGRDRESETRNRKSRANPATPRREAAHGTPGGYQRHLRVPEVACPECKAAQAANGRRHRARVRAARLGETSS